MALTGELTDLSLAELIEFFCNQRKTGRLKVVYPTGPGYFYLQSGSVVHARVGELRGIEAVYFALTQRNASFTFSPAFEAPEHSINQPWTSVVLEGLRRMDEGVKPPNPFPENSGTHVEEVKSAKVEAKPQGVEPVTHHVEKPAETSRTSRQSQPHAVPFLSQTEHASHFASRPWKLGAVFAAIALIVAVVAVPWGWYARSKAARLANEVKPVSVSEQPVSNSQPAPIETPATSTQAETSAPVPNADATDVTRRQHEARLKEEARGREKAAQSMTSLQPSEKAKSSPANGAKKVTVQVTYDENGRVTQASGGDATALRIARQKRFPAGKAGSATVTIPIN
ncbi:MAG TPA: DUF4388 domain-containing protein [Pyrinomonadaceae bacterium]|nr:DUF4388 domain-containing protein [Pyrinomonadaceae bacterium]